MVPPRNEERVLFPLCGGQHCCSAQRVHKRFGFKRKKECHIKVSFPGGKCGKNDRINVLFIWRCLFCIRATDCALYCSVSFLQGRFGTSSSEEEEKLQRNNQYYFIVSTVAGLKVLLVFSFINFLPFVSFFTISCSSLLWRMT